jgi:acyl dehydratase
MTLDLSAVGHETEPFFFEYTEKDVILYALGIGAKREELDYLYEGKGPLVYPSFAVVPSYAALSPLVAAAKADMSLVVHGAQTITLHKPIPSKAKLETRAKIDGIYDLKRLSQVVFSTKTFDSGELLFENEWMLVVRDTGGFGGPRPPKGESVKLPGDDTAPLFERVERTSPEQALLYRLSGDLNPLHADPEFARAVGFSEGPILHGLCTFGYMARAVIHGALAGESRRLRSLTVQFKKPVWPGEELRTLGYEVERGTVALATYAEGRTEAVTGGWAKLVSGS